jgi:hypothetical protein
VLPARKRKIPVAIANREKLKKITVRVPADLLAAAQKETGAGITETVRQGLEKLRGKVKFDLSLDQIRNDRR